MLDADAFMANYKNYSIYKEEKILKSKVLKKILMVALTASLVVTPVISVSASTTGTTTGGSSSAGSSSSGGGKGSSGGSSAAKAAPATSTVKLGNGTVLKTTVGGSYSAKGVSGIAVTAPKNVVGAALGVAAGEQAYVSIADSNYGPNAQQCIRSTATALGAEVGPVLDIFAGKLKGSQITNVSKANKIIDFKVAAPSGFALKAGYEFAIIRVEADGTVTVLPDWDDDPTTITFYTNTFGVFAMAQVPAGTLDNMKVLQYNQANGL